jgi:hypothetical protein
MRAERESHLVIIGVRRDRSIPESAMQLGDETGDIVRALMYEIFILNMKYTNKMLECKFPEMSLE